ncbi:MAG: STT3 domain-containing protein, partial [Thermoplasmataceae archaeon]
MENQLDQNITLSARVAKHTDFLVVGILFVFYLFFANYFAWGLTFVNGGGISTLPTSGGSDPYYNFYLILHFISTGHWLVHDPALNFPFGSTNPRNPFFHVMLVFVAEVLSPIFGAKMAAFYAFEEFDAVFGALLIIPVYLVTKELFGKRAGYISAFLYTLMPSNLSAGILSGGRMHTPELIFAFFTIYFFAMAIKFSGKGRILENLRDYRTLPSRIRDFYHENRKSTTYALLAGASLGGLMLAWQGYAYIEAIILIYIVIQLIANLILKRPTGYITFYFALFIILGFAMGAYYYQAIGEGPGWYNAELLIGILIIFFSAVINIIGRRPWVLIIPILIIVSAVGILGMDFFAPSLFHTLISGDGYFIKTRVYSTIAEAQAPALGSYISGFGVAQFIFGIAGMIYVVYLYLKERKEEVLFIMVFSLVSIYMSFAAARFNITAAPAYAILGGAIIMYFAKMVRIDDLKNRKNVGYASVRKAIKGNIKWVQATFVVIIALVLLIPSGLSMVSASVPANSAAHVNTQLGSAIPAFLKGTNNTTVSFAGALGVPIDNATQPIALSLAWLSTQDTNLPLTEKPAYVSWWDYGFQELYQGQHPTVADDFQQGIPQAGELLMAQNQSQDIALFIAIDLQANFQQNGNHFSSNVTNTLISMLGVNEYKII